MRWALTIDYNPVREKLMIKKVGVVDKPEAIIRYKDSAFVDILK